MTTTTPGCPAAGCLKEGIINSTRNASGVEHVNIDLICAPQWRLEMMNSIAKAYLGMAHAQI
jgi:metal-sulfur cluster biosynthetic enzyme